MRLIYREIHEQSGTYQKDSLCVQVRAFIPEAEEYGLPALIGLESGEVSNDGGLIFDYGNWEAISQSNVAKYKHSEADIIRQAIQMFDRFKEKVYKEADDLKARKASNG